MPVLLLIELLVVIVPVAELPITALLRSAPSLSEPSKLILVSTLTVLTPRACSRPSCAAGTALPASAPRFTPAGDGFFSPAAQVPCTPMVAASRAAMAQMADVFMTAIPIVRWRKRGPHRREAVRTALSNGR